MSNIENLIQKIDSDAKTTSEQIINDAKKEAENIIETARKKATMEAEKIVEKANANVNPTIEKILQATNLKSRDKILKVQEEVVADILERVNKKLTDLSEDEYVNYLSKKLENMDLKDAELVVPKKYVQAVRERLQYKVSETKFVENGFVISGTNFDYNNKFDSLIEANRQDLEIKIREKLFEA